MRLYYLDQYTVGDVRQLMRGCLPMKPEEAYETARSLLKNRYGQGHKVATAYVERLTKIQPVASEDASVLQKFSVMLTSCKNALKRTETSCFEHINESCSRLCRKFPDLDFFVCFTLTCPYPTLCICCFKQ